MTMQQINPLLRRVFMFLEDGDWQTADEYCERMLDMEPENALAYLGKLMANLRVAKREELANVKSSFEKDANYLKAMRFGDDALKAELQSYTDCINARNEKARLEALYQKASRQMLQVTTEQAFLATAAAFEKISGYKNSADKRQKCFELAEAARKDTILIAAENAMKPGDDAGCYQAIELLESIGGWRDADKTIQICQGIIRNNHRRKMRRIILALLICIVVAVICFIQFVAVPSKTYKDAISLMDRGMFAEAYEKFSEIRGFKDSADKADALQYYAAEVGEYVTFGTYEQDGYTSNGKEDIEWLVLAKENNRLLVISRYALAKEDYHEKNVDVTWETCSLRKWLNTDFLASAFSSAEREAIPVVTVKADKNLKYATDPGNDTRDKVFLLSVEEVERYFSSVTARNCLPTDDVKWRITMYSYQDGFCNWWLRSPGNKQNRAAVVWPHGSIYENSVAYSDDVVVRPALWIDLDSEANHSTEELVFPTPAPTPIPTATPTPRPTTSKSTTHTCEASGCYREGTKTITGFSGATEYYCTTHYNEMVDIWDSLTTKYMACELCDKKTNCTYTTSLGLSFWVCSSCRSWMLGD